MLLSSNRLCNRLSLFVGLIGCLQMLARFAAHTDGGKNDDHREAAASNGQRQNERARCPYSPAANTGAIMAATDTEALHQPVMVADLFTPNRGVATTAPKYRLTMPAL